MEYSTRNRFRIHPVIREFVQRKLNRPNAQYLYVLAISVFVLLLSWWSLLLLSNSSAVNAHVFASSYWIMACLGAVIGFETSYRWGGIKTLIGRSALSFSLGLLAQVFGQLMYAYYVWDYKIEVPYPSLGDIGYFGTIPLYGYGIFLLARSSGIQMNLRTYRDKISAFFIPVLMLFVTYSLLLRNYSLDLNNPLKVFLDFAYPFGEAMYISIAIIIFIFSRTILDGIMRSKATFILVALVIQFTADFAFLYTQDSYVSGNYIEIIYLVSYFAMTIALLSLRSIQIRVKNV